MKFKNKLLVITAVAMGITGTIACAKILDLGYVSKNYSIPNIYYMQTMNPSSDDYQDYMYLIKNGIIAYNDDTAARVTDDAAQRMYAYELDRLTGSIHTVDNAFNKDFQLKKNPESFEEAVSLLREVN